MQCNNPSPRLDPVDAMLSIGERFLEQAIDLDERTSAAIEGGARAADIARLRDMAATDRLRALSCFSSAAPYCAPRLQAVEVKPASPHTVSRFERAIEGMSEEQITGYLKMAASGTLTMGAFDDSDATEDLAHAPQ